jgi:hypothetical protein
MSDFFYNDLTLEAVMSDGPHRSLTMRPAWKRVAKFADTRTFAREQVRDAVIAAITVDWRADVADNVAGVICEVLGGHQDSLFRDQKLLQLEALRPMTAGRELSQLLLDCAIHRAASGETSIGDAAVEAAADALDIWSARHGRQIEEHYCRETTDWRAEKVRGRIEDGIRSAPHKDLVRQLLKLEVRTLPRTPPKQTGLEDGVPIA